MHSIQDTACLAEAMLKSRWTAHLTCALHAPTTKELSTQSLYDATRAYAEASSDVRSASESLQSLLAAAANSGSVTAQDGSSIEDISEELRRSIEGFRAAERRLLEVLVREEGK